MKLLHVNLHSSEKHPIQIRKELVKYGGDLKLRVENNAPIKAKSFSSKKYSVDMEQENNGKYLTADTFYTYETMVDPAHLNIKIKVFNDTELLGECDIGQQIYGDYGVKMSNIISISNGEEIGHVHFEYLFLPADVTFDIGKMGNTKYDVDTDASWYVGHRGLGYTQHRSTTFLENTIASFVEAYKQGADLVEFDVQLTKDLVPVIYHDDNTAVLTPKDDKSYNVKRVPVKDLTLEEIRSSRMDFARNDTGLNYDERFGKLFPELNELFGSIPENLGVVLEVKYPEPDQGMEGELLSKSLVVDRTLETLSECHIKQSLIFCSFDFDICLMLKHKQSLYPVLFCSCGEDAFTTYNPWEPYDMRTRTRMMAANSIIASGLDGISICGDPLAGKKDECKALSSFLKANNKLFFTWGSCNNNAQFVAIQKSLGVNGVISDKLSTVVKN